MAYTAAPAREEFEVASIVEAPAREDFGSGLACGGASTKGIWGGFVCGDAGTGGIWGGLACGGASTEVRSGWKAECGMLRQPGTEGIVRHCLLRTVVAAAVRGVGLAAWPCRPACWLCFEYVGNIFFVLSLL